MSEPPTKSAPDCCHTSGRIVAWTALSLLGCVGIARLAVWLQAAWAPLLMFPVLVGVSVGLLLAGLAVGLRLPVCMGLAATAVVLALGVVVAELFLVYYDDVTDRQRALNENPKAAFAFSDAERISFVEFLERGDGGQHWHWALDAACTAAGALATSLIARRLYLTANPVPPSNGPDSPSHPSSLKPQASRLPP